MARNQNDIKKEQSTSISKSSTSSMEDFMSRYSLLALSIIISLFIFCCLVKISKDMIQCSLFVMFIQVMIVLEEIVEISKVKSGDNISCINGVRYYKVTRNTRGESLFYIYSDEEITPEKFRMQLFRLKILGSIFISLMILWIMNYLTICLYLMILETLFIIWDSFWGQKQYGVTIKHEILKEEDVITIDNNLYYIVTEKETTNQEKITNIEEDNINQQEYIEEDNINQQEDIENIEEYMEKRDYNQRRMHRIILYLIGVLILLLIIFLYFNSLNNVAF